MEVKISVTNCTDCPFRGTTRGQGYSYENCYHEDNLVYDYDCELPGYDTGDSFVPPFCPLGLAGTKNIKDQGKFKTVVIDENTSGVKKTELGYSLDGDLIAHCLRVKIDLLVNGHINSNMWIKSDGNLSATGDITAGTSIISSKDIDSEGNISAGTIIYTEGSVAAGNDVRAGTSIRAERIDAVGCVDVGSVVKTGANGDRLSIYGFATDYKISDNCNLSYEEVRKIDIQTDLAIDDVRTDHERTKDNKQETHNRIREESQWYNPPNWNKMGERGNT